MRRPLVAANWKLNGRFALCDEYVARFSSPSSIEICAFPPALFVDRLVRDSNSEYLQIGVQNISFERKGAFTGELAADMVAELGASWILVGHSERRQLFGESPDVVTKKYGAVKESGLRPILCVGETEQERQQGEAVSIVTRDIVAILDSQGADAFQDAVIAYEPVWSIGTGNAATPTEAQEMHQSIRQIVSDEVRILYGGSVNEANAGSLIQEEDIDGFLVGGASLDVNAFAAICHTVSEQSR